MKTKNTQALSDEVALKELTDFINEYQLTPISEDEISQDFSTCLHYVKHGLLTFEDGVPVLKLKEPIKDSDGNVADEVIRFKTRILAKDARELEKGLNISKDKIYYSQKAMAFLAGISIGYLDKLNRFDNKVVSELAPLFM